MYKTKFLIVALSALFILPAAGADESTSLFRNNGIEVDSIEQKLKWGEFKGCTQFALSKQHDFFRTQIHMYSIYGISLQSMN